MNFLGLQSSKNLSSLRRCPFDLHVQVFHCRFTLARVEARFYLDLVIGFTMPFPPLSHISEPQGLYYCGCLITYSPDCVFHHHQLWTPPSLPPLTPQLPILPWQAVKHLIVPHFRRVGNCAQHWETWTKTTCSLLISVTLVYSLFSL